MKTPPKKNDAIPPPRWNHFSAKAGTKSSSPFKRDEANSKACQVLGGSVDLGTRGAVAAATESHKVLWNFDRVLWILNKVL